VIKTKEMIVDYRKRRTEHTPIQIDGAVMERVETTNYHGPNTGHDNAYSPSGD
jgi:hypothetical protein